MSAVQQLLMAGSGSPLIVLDAADFDGTADSMARGAGLSGAADSKTGILSFWVRLDGGDSTTQRIISTGTVAAAARFARSLSNTFTAFAANPAGTQILFMETTGTYLTSATWRHVLMSWDMATPGAAHIYVNDVDDLGTPGAFTDDTIDYTYANWGVGANPDASNKLNGCLAEFYFAPGQYLDFSIVANRRKFISGGGKPVYLGATGALPTGTAPIVYQHLDNGEAVANFATNRGTGGNFTITGTLDTGSTSPSD